MREVKLGPKREEVSRLSRQRLAVDLTELMSSASVLARSGLLKPLQNSVERVSLCSGLLGVEQAVGLVTGLDLLASEPAPVQAGDGLDGRGHVCESDVDLALRKQWQMEASVTHTEGKWIRAARPPS